MGLAHNGINKNNKKFNNNPKLHNNFIQTNNKKLIHPFKLMKVSNNQNHNKEIIDN